MFVELFLFFIFLVFFFYRYSISIYYNFNLIIILILLTHAYFKFSIVIVLSLIWVIVIFYININLNNFKNYSTILISVYLLILSLILMLNTTNIYIFIVGFELMLLVSIFLLKLTIKTDRGLEAIIEMYSWGVIGSFFLLNSLIYTYFSAYNIYFFYNYNNIRDFFFFCGFSIKIPLWPFTSWLLKAHVEASTEFSIFLSGFLVKFGVFGLIQFFYILNSISIYKYIELFSLFGLIEATIKLFAQVDLKKIIALTTIIETNWIALFVITNNNIMLNLSFLLIFFHCLTTTAEFYIVDILYKRFGTRSINHISSISNLFPVLSKFIIFLFFIIIGLPGTSIFYLKFLYLSFYLYYNFYIFVIVLFLFLFILPVYFINLYLKLNNNFTQNKQKGSIIKQSDLSKKELLILLFPISLNYVFGILSYFLL